MRLLIDDLSDDLAAYPVEDIESIVITSTMEIDKKESEEINRKIAELTKIDKEYPPYSGPNVGEIVYLQRLLRELKEKLLYKVIIKIVLKQITNATKQGYGAKQTVHHFVIGEYSDNKSAIKKFNEVCQILADDKVKLLYISQLEATL